MITTFLQVSASSFGQKVTLKEKKISLEKLFEQIRQQTGYDFVFDARILNAAKTIDVKFLKEDLTSVLKQCLSGQNMTFEIIEHSIVIKEKEHSFLDDLINNFTSIEIKGRVLDENGNPVPGASIKIKDKNLKAVVSSTNGNFSITASEGDILVVSFVGYKTQEIKIRVNQPALTIRLEVSETAMKDVVITGMMVRKKESFTGATATYTGEELKTIGAQNVIQSLKTLDPSFIQIENNLAGSNPNVLPSMQIRGQTSLSTSALRDQFSVDPNQPLFILDGFESTLRTIVDLDINTVLSVTILKDAASTAIYGSRASNGVVVVETKRPLPGKIRLSYTSDLDAELPDLSSYNMMNATEKLAFEKLSGAYIDNIGLLSRQLSLDTIYNERLKEVLRGVDTYWLDKPLRTGFSQRHNVSASGGDQTLRYDVAGSIRKNNATMTGTKRDDWGANVGLYYRAGIFNIGNRTYVSGSQSTESQNGKFSSWVNLNPYYRVLGSDQMYIEQVSTPNKLVRVANPFYNASLTGFDNTSTFQLQNSLQITADLNKSLRVSLNAQLVKSSGEIKKFTSPLNTEFVDVTDPVLRGRYVTRKDDGLNYTVNANLTYGNVFAQKHSLNTFLRAELSENNSRFSGFTALGFPNASNGNPAYAYGFASGSTPTAASSLTRRSSLVVSVNYSYDQRYNLDLNANMDGSTAFGSNKRYKPYYAAGISWNISNEKFMKGLAWISRLKLRGNIGLTGNQNFGNVSQSVFQYLTTINSFGQGVILNSPGAPDLEWQSTLQTSVGLDGNLFNNRLNFILSAYRNVTDPLVVAITLPSSTGLSSYPFNAGSNTARGVEAELSFSPIYKPGKVIWTLRVTGTSIDQKYDKFDNKLSALNNALRESNALTRYRDGYSPFDLWAVPSLGIDPGSGREVFLKKNGQHTFIYDVNDQIVMGNSRAKAEGVFNTTVFYKGFTAGVYIRYIFGRDLFNDALFSKVENISYQDLVNNQDKRALYSRWKNSGDVSEFKSIAITDDGPKSSRFIQTENSFTGESIHLGYEFRGGQWLDKAKLSTLNLTARSNNLFYSSSVRRERGIDYPFAYTVSLSIRATFK
ncbi:TonB-linked SusC/RagA family outer membrane protein [Pedobacter africanus]|uniref:TonB-linked SusC/RagA family outer membrane protein n=2 Tax=Pedobacter africanus TaxID=151894 RepID=A0ACC6L1K5_9SPHI|nr:TonB-linked SusC/RagA family outer membrane protein [Pedobacter africanus]